MNGEIKIESKKGVGTSVSFSITFVKGTSEQITVKEAPAISVEILRDKRILVTDDNEMNRLVASTILEEYGVIVDEAVNGQEAVEKIKNNVYDIVLMDIQMPVMDGVEATQEIRKNFSKTLPIIALTAFAIKGDNEKFINAGMDDYLSKPFEENQLLQIVCRWVEKMQVSDPAKYKPLYDLNKLSEIAQGNPDFMDKMLTLFTEQIPMALEELYIAYEQNNFDRIRYIINRIKPTVDNLNIESIKKEIQQIELLSLDGKTSEALLGLIQYVDTVLKKVVVAIQLKSGNH
jgi:CheY-like chemotaxis protein/HPt (histidine-containing phosphotransfer) domain-containing protein